jgi:hypothetical protein
LCGQREFARLRLVVAIEPGAGQFGDGVGIVGVFARALLQLDERRPGLRN